MATPEMTVADFRRALEGITEQLKDQRDRALADAEGAEGSDTLNNFYRGLALGARVALATVHGWTGGEFGETLPRKSGQDTAVTS